MTNLFTLIDATWPAASTCSAGGFLIRKGQGAGSRVSAATLEAAFEGADIDAALAASKALGQRGLFMVRDGEEALDAALAARGFAIEDPSVEYRAPLAALAHEVPPVTAFAHWPPLQIARDVWEETGITAARQAVMERPPAPKTCVLGRTEDRAAGAAFVAISGGTAMLHALTILPEMRRKGLARAMMAEAVRWAIAEGARDLSLIVRRDNAEANALYRALGMEQGAQYHYRAEAKA